MLHENVPFSLKIPIKREKKEDFTESQCPSQAFDSASNYLSMFTMQLLIQLENHKNKERNANISA